MQKYIEHMPSEIELLELRMLVLRAVDEGTIVGEGVARVKNGDLDSEAREGSIQILQLSFS